MIIKVLSFNVQHFCSFKTGEIDFDLFASAIRDTGADIIGLNEVRGKGERNDYEAQTEIIAEKLGYYYFFAKAIDVGGRNPYGNAFLSRYPILSAENIPIPDPVEKIAGNFYETRCLLKAKVDVCGGLDVLVTHFGLSPDEQVNAVGTVCSELTDRCILMGDFNVTPGNPVLGDIRKRLADTADGEGDMFSFPSDIPDRKIDYMFVSDGIKKVRSEILSLVVSDHRPYYSELDI